MALITDLTGVQFRVLNRKKGPAVWSTRAQCDKKSYQQFAKYTCEQQVGLDVKQAQVTKIIVSNDEAKGVETSYQIQFFSKAVIITTGTFLRGLMHFGPDKRPGGRSGEPASNSLSDSLVKIGFQLGRLKTGTPPRLSKKTINFEKTIPQPGDEPIPYFTFWRDELFHVEQNHDSTESARVQDYPTNSVLKRNGGQMLCFITHTTERTRRIVLDNLDKSPLYSGEIKGIGPRYCPSIEDKIVRFAQKGTHQIFLEPEGSNTDEIYVNGLSTSMPITIQYEMVRSILGCENAEIVRPGYAVEYDFVFPSQIKNTLETKVCGNLFLAGQINGTSGYEEAAAQGIMAGINAALRVKGKPPSVLTRDQAYIGVLIDDLVTKEIVDPYRMFTSRAEFRLLLREDNSDLRLSELGYQIGLLPYRKYKKFLDKKNTIEQEIERLHRTRVGQNSLAQILARPEIRYTDLPSHREDLSEEIINEIEIIVKYDGYIQRQQAEVLRLRSLESKVIPEGFKFDEVAGLKTESRLKLSKFNPKTLGQALRIGGVTPADINLIMVWLKRREKTNNNLI